MPGATDLEHRVISVAISGPSTGIGAARRAGAGHWANIDALQAAAPGAIKPDPGPGLREGLGHVAGD